jgi:hypothetical protein
MEAQLLARFAIPRSDRTPAQCEDAAGFRVTRDRWVAAVADGAGDAAFSGRWAACLVEQFLREPTPDIGPVWLEQASRAFLAGLSLASLPWYLWERLERGVFATLLGVRFEPARATLAVVAVGDSCIAWYGPAGEGFFPEFAAADFGFQTRALGYQLGREPTIDGLVMAKREIALGPGESLLFLMTDALAAWYSRERAAGAEPWRLLTGLSEDGGFADWVELQRESGQLRDDDVTLLTVRVVVPGGRVRRKSGHGSSARRAARRVS